MHLYLQLKYLTSIVVEVSFTTPDVQVNEDSGLSEVCFIGSIESARSYIVELGHMPSGENSATRKSLLQWS